jgi:pimeloyl-ACP methyl ester carboxylesterase
METKKLELRYRDRPLHIEYVIRPGPKEAILYLHGMGCSKNDFLGAMDTRELSAYTLVAFDFPGCGNSPYPDTMTIGIDDLVEITSAIISQLALGDLVVIGHSMRGLVALLCIERYGEGVRGFINVEGNLAPEDCIFSREVTKHGYPEFRDLVFRTMKQQLSQSENRGFQTYAETLERHSSPKAMFDYCPSLVDYSDNGNLLQRFTDLELSKIFIYGSENRWLSYISELKERGCEVVEIGNSNHFPFVDNPQDYYKAVSNFLREKLRS